MKFDEMATSSYVAEKQFIFLRLTVLREVGLTLVPDCGCHACLNYSVPVSGKRIED